jgi:serine/threonine kinase 3
MLTCCVGNAKQPNILGQMIAEAREIRENQSYRSNAATSAAAGAKQNHAEESVSGMYSVHVNEKIP